MLKIIKNIFLFITLLVVPNILNAQNGMKFNEFAARLETYFSKEMIDDLRKKLPQGTNYTVWGWDVGDFSGDGINDVGFTVRLLSEKKRIVQVYLFSDIDGYLSEITHIPFEFVDLPLEVGIVIKSNACYVMRKNQQFDWSVIGYRFSFGNLLILDNFSTKRIGKYTKESYKNYQSLYGTEKFIITNTDEKKFNAKFLMIPSYYRGKQIYNGYTEEPLADDIDYVYKGAWYWKGSEDASYTIKSAYDNDFIYFTVNIRDDTFVPISCDSCPADYLEIWFDMDLPGNSDYRFAKISGDRVTFKDINENTVYSLKIYPGNMTDRRAFVKEVSSTEDLENYQKNALENIKCNASIIDSGYSLKFKLPFLLFGYEGNPVEGDNMFEIGCTFVLHDIDNEFRPEEESCIATSIFSPYSTATYGSVILVPKDKWFGESDNIFTDDIMRYLQDLGF